MPIPYLLVRLRIQLGALSVYTELRSNSTTTQRTRCGARWPHTQRCAVATQTMVRSGRSFGCILERTVKAGYARWSSGRTPHGLRCTAALYCCVSVHAAVNGKVDPSPARGLVRDAYTPLFCISGYLVYERTTASEIADHPGVQLHYCTQLL